MKENFSSATIVGGRALSPAAITYLEGRGISGETASRHGIYSDRHPEIGPSIVFPFIEGGKEVNAKWRTRDKDMRQVPNATKTFYNADAIDLAASEDKFLLITEGEIDCLSAIEAGYPWTVSVPDGAPNQRHDGPVDVAEDKKFSFVWHCWDRLAKVRRVILAGDADTNGQNLNHELQRRLGPERCLFVEYPDGCKDLNDVLVKHGGEGVRDCIANAKPYPIKGLYRLSEFTGPEYPETFHIGFGREMDMMLRVSLGQFMVVTGVPTHGKSQFVDTMLYHFARDHGWKSLVGTFESPPVPFWRDAMRQRVLHKSIRDMSMEERARADKFLNEHFIFLGQNTSADEDLDLSVDEIIDLARIAVIRDGIKVLCLDPWNEIEHRKRRDETGTDYTGRAIRQLKRFARLYNVLVIVVAHPRKPPAGNYSEPPSLYDIEGCYSDDTEVMTERGWLRHAELTPEDRVACFDGEGDRLVYANPTRIIRKKYAGEVFRLKGYGYDLLVTPEHRVVVKPKWSEPSGTQRETGIGRPVRWQKDKWQFCAAGDLPTSSFSIPLAAHYDGDDTGVSQDMAALAGWYVSEGGPESSGVCISQAVGEDAEDIMAILNRLEVPFTVYRCPPSRKGGKLPMLKIYIGVRGRRDVVNWLRSECGEGCREKRVPNSIKFGLPSVRHAFLSAFLRGDGCFRENRGTHSVTTTSRGLVDDLQSLALGLGFSCCWTERSPASARHSVSWHLTIGTNGRRETALRRARNVTSEYYEGDVWCLTVPTGAYIVRRNGRATICGNSSHWRNKPEIGLCLWRPDTTKPYAEVHIQKIKFRANGNHGVVSMTGDFNTGTYTDVRANT